MKLRMKIILLSIGTCMLPLCLFLSLLNLSVQKQAERQAREFCYYNAQNLESVLNQAFDSAYNTSLALISNKSVRDYLTDPHHNLPQLEQTQNTLYSLVDNKPFITSLNLFSPTGRRLSWGQAGQLFPEDTARADELDGMYFWGIDEIGNMKAQPFLCRLLRDSQQVSLHWGYAKIYLDADWLGRQFAFPSADYVSSMLCDGTGRVIFPCVADDYDVKAGAYTEERTLNHSDWKLVTRVDSRYASSASQSFLGVLRVGLVLAVAASIVLALSLSRLLIRPIRRISETMSIIGSGQFGAHLSLPRRDELGMLAQQLNHMSDELQRLLDEAVHNHTMFIEAKLNALQSQVNPHFLYNTLDNIHWMSEMHHEPEISRMISSLSKLFRLALSTDKTGIWPLSKEIEHVRCYIDILNLRFQGTVTFSLRMEDHLENIDVPALMLQPLIENAVQHGVRDKENGIVSVEIRTEGNQMIYQVRDNGSADADYINHLIQNGPEPGSRKGQALNNLYQRITLRFGQEADFHCVSTEEGSLFELRLPIKRKEERL